MRDILTGIAVIVILLLTTILVAPYFVDWNGQRVFLERRLSAALGQKVTIGGGIDLKVLPTPYLVLDQVVVGDEDGNVRIGIHHVDLELSAAPLLHGAFDIVEVRLQEPTVRIALQPDRSLPSLPAAPAFQADVHFDRIQVSDGTLAISDPSSGRTFTFDHIDLDADAGSFTGPFKVAGAGGLPDQRTRFRLSTATPDKGRAHARLIVEETSDHPALELDGAVGLAARDGAAAPNFDGQLVLSGHLTGLAEEPPPWTLSGPVHADPHGVDVAAGELRLGAEDAGLTLQADLDAAFDETPHMALKLAAKQIDVDRLSGAPIGATKPRPPKLPELATIRRAVASLAPPLPTRVDVAIDHITYGGEALSDIKARGSIGIETPQPLLVSASGPAGTRISLDGTLAPKAYAPFTGIIDLEAENLGRAVDWLGTIDPDLPWRSADIPFASLSIKGTVQAREGRIDSDKLTLSLDRSLLTGPVRLVLGREAVPTRLEANLAADDLDLDSLPGVEASRATVDNLDLDLKLRANALKIASLGSGSLATGPLALAVQKAGHRIDLTAFRLQNIGGANLSATGRLDADETSVTADLAATRLDAAASLLQQLAPGAAADAIAARAPGLVPAEVKVTAKRTVGSDGTATSFALAGDLGATKIDATLVPGGDDQAVSLSGSLKAADGAALLQQLFAIDKAADAFGPGELRFLVSGAPSSPLDADVSGSIGKTRVGFKGHVAALALPLSASGSATLASGSIAPVLQAVKIGLDKGPAVPVDLAATASIEGGATSLRDIAGRVADVPVAGSLTYKAPQGDGPALTGSLSADRLSLASIAALIVGPRNGADTAGWSQAPFVGGLTDPPRTRVGVNAAAFDFGMGRVARQASFDLALAPDTLTLDRLAADLDGGSVAGHMVLRRDAGQAIVEGKVALVHQKFGGDGFSALLDGSVDFAGSGTSPAAIVGNLAGSGTATATQLVVDRADPSALARVLKDVETDTLAVDQDTIIRAFDEDAKAPLDLGTKRFSVGLASGQLRFASSEDQTGADAKARVEGSYDIARGRLDGRLVETLLALPKNWNGAPPTITISLSGPPDRPTRSLDVTNFLNAVAARALARETARIDAYELDIRERAFFNARLQADKRREEDRLKAEADRKAKLEAARLERARQEEAARAAREAPTPPLPPADDRGRPEPPKAPAPAAAKPPATPDPSALGRY